jgi:hypothetical protein
MIGRYLTLWQSELPRVDVKEVAQLSLLVGSLYQAQTYSQLMTTLMPDDLGTLRDADIGWLRGALRQASGEAQAET